MIPIRKKVNGSDILGNPVEYDFEVVSAKVGLEIVHEYTALVLVAIPQIKALFQGFPVDEIEEGSPEAARRIKQILIEVIQVLPRILSADRVWKLKTRLLANARIGGDSCDGEGDWPGMIGDPYAVYPAVFWALVANFPKYFGPFSEAIVSAEPGDTIPGSQP